MQGEGSALDLSEIRVHSSDMRYSTFQHSNTAAGETPMLRASVNSVRDSASIVPGKHGKAVTILEVCGG